MIGVRCFPCYYCPPIARVGSLVVSIYAVFIAILAIGIHNQRLIIFLLWICTCACIYFKKCCMHFLPLSSCLGIAITVYFSFAGKRIPRTESGLVGGNCAGKQAHKAKSGSGWELERHAGAVRAWTGAVGLSLGVVCVPGGFSGIIWARKHLKTSLICIWPLRVGFGHVVTTQMWMQGVRIKANNPSHEFYSCVYVLESGFLRKKSSQAFMESLHT